MTYLIWMPKGETNNRPAPAPVFMSDPQQGGAADRPAEHPWAWWLGGHPVFVAVIPSTAMCAVTSLFRVSVAAASIFFDVMPCVVPTLIVDRENKSGLSTSRWRLLMD